MAVPQLKLSKQDLAFLGDQYMTEIKSIDGGRAELIDDYELWVENYEGGDNVAPPESEKPWEGASDAHIPITGTDSDVTYARWMNAVFGQFPKFMIRALSSRWIEFARSTQRFSEYLEDQEMPLYKTLQQLFLTTIKFGTAVVFLPWENRPVKFHTLDDNDEFVEDPTDVLDRPNPHVIHPKDFLLPIHSSDLQEAPWCGYRYKLRKNTLRLWDKTKFFRKDAVTLLEAMFSQQGDETKANLAIDTAEQRHDKPQEARERAAGIIRTKIPDELDMVHIFARIDVDGDGLEESVNFHMHEATGTIARIAFDHYRHRRRPFIDFHFFPRDGIFYSIGIPEMLRNIQKNVDVTMRQIQDNNTVKNTQSFRATAGGNVGPDEPFHPAKIYFVKRDDIFEPLRMGDPTVNTSMTDLQLMLRQGETRTGITDPTPTPGDRTPATSFLAARQEAAQRMDTMIGGMRESLGEMWMQVLELYAQFQPIHEYEIRDGENYEMVEWAVEGDEAFRRRVQIKPTVSTQALNKAVARMEMALLLEQTIAFNQSQGTLLDLFLKAQDPFLKQFIQDSLTGQHKIMQRIFDTYELAKDQDELLPNPEDYLPDVSNLQLPVGGGGQGPDTLAEPQGLSPGGTGGLAPPTAPGRPSPGAGIPRDSASKQGES